MSDAQTARVTEKAAAIEELRLQAKRFVEMVAASQIAMKQLMLWGGPTASDMGNVSEEIANERLAQTLASLDAAQALLETLGQPCPNFPDTTIGDALMRIASR